MKKTKENIYNKLASIIDGYISKNVSTLNIKKYYSKNKNFKNLLSSLKEFRWDYDREKTEDDQNFDDVVKEFLFNRILIDRIFHEKDNPINEQKKENFNISNIFDKFTSIRTNSCEEAYLIIKKLEKIGYRISNIVDSLESVKDYPEYNYIVYDEDRYTLCRFSYFTGIDYKIIEAKEAIDILNRIESMKKIKRPDIDPFDEEEWGYEEELNENIKSGYEYLEYCAIKYNSPQEAVEISNKLMELGFDIYEPWNVRYDCNYWKYFALNSARSRFVLCSDGYLKKSGINNIIDYEDFLKISPKKIKEIKNIELDPFDEENWGYEEENIIKEQKDFNINDHSSTEGIKIISKLKEYIDIFGWDPMMYDLVGRNFIKYDFKNNYNFSTFKMDAYVVDYIENDIHNLFYIPKDCIEIIKIRPVKNFNDPFGEEEMGWEEIVEQLDYFYGKKLAIKIKNKEEYDELMDNLNEMGYCWNGGKLAKDLEYTFGSNPKDIIWLNSDEKTLSYSKANGFAFRLNSQNYTFIDFEDFKKIKFKKLKKIKNLSVDPFDEENWGYEEEIKENKMKTFEQFDANEEEVGYTDRTYVYGDKGKIRYRIYDDDVIIFMGSYVDKKYRGRGVFRKMIIELFKEFENKDVYIPITNKKIINMFLKMGFEIIKEPIRYWGRTSNATNVYKKF